MDESILGAGWWFYEGPLFLVAMIFLSVIATFVIVEKPTQAWIIPERLEDANRALWLWYVAFGADLIAVIVLVLGGLASTGQIVFGLLTLPLPLIARARCVHVNAIRCDLADRAVFDTVSGGFTISPRGVPAVYGGRSA